MRSGQWCKAGLPTSFVPVKRAAIIILAMLVSPADARGNVIYARGAWAAIDRGATCEALSRSQKVEPRSAVQPVVGLTFTPDHRRWGEFHARLSRTPRADASVLLQVGDQPFMLAARSGWAWSRGPLQAQAIIAALREGATMRVESRDTAGLRFSDPYLLDGAPTAIDAAAARCALRGAGKIK